MDKSWFKSKTFWGTLVAAAIAAGQVFGLPYTDTVVAKIVEIFSGVIAVLGLRAAVGQTITATT